MGLDEKFVREQIIIYGWAKVAKWIRSYQKIIHHQARKGKIWRQTHQERSRELWRLNKQKQRQQKKFQNRNEIHEIIGKDF